MERKTYRQQRERERERERERKRAREREQGQIQIFLSGWVLILQRGQMQGGSKFFLGGS